MKLTDIGDVVVHLGNPPEGNPYRGDGRNRWEFTKDDPTTVVRDDGRLRALTAFRDSDDVGNMTFWSAPAGGGAHRLTEATEINWAGMRP